jgi:hypothetical protein
MKQIESLADCFDVAAQRRIRPGARTYQKEATHTGGGRAHRVGHGDERRQRRHRFDGSRLLPLSRFEAGRLHQQFRTRTQFALV